MFRHEGPARSTRKNAILAAYLAIVAGFVNSSGFILAGNFTSHVTGSVGRFASDVARRDAGAASLALVLVAAFFVGAFFASVVIESNVFRSTARAYGCALLTEALSLGAFILVAERAGTSTPRGLDVEAGLLCLAMGMQDSLVTQLSGSVVRTTHLTGIVTDLGIEVARWYRWQRERWSSAAPVGARSPAHRPKPESAFLLSTIFAGFVAGGVGGALLTPRAGCWAMMLPVAAVLAGGLYALQQGGADATESAP